MHEALSFLLTASTHDFPVVLAKLISASAISAFATGPAGTCWGGFCNDSTYVMVSSWDLPLSFLLSHSLGPDKPLPDVVTVKGGTFFYSSLLLLLSHQMALVGTFLHIKSTQ